MNTKNIVLSNIIGVNPKGTLTYEDTLTMNGNNDIVNTSSSVNKKNIKKIQNNEIICDGIENFQNYNQYNNIKIKNIILIFFFILIILFIYIIFIKKKS